MWRCKGYGRYLMGKVCASDPGLENMRVYVVPKLILNYNLSYYDEPHNDYSDDQLCAQILLYRRHNIKNISPCIP